ncbi:hypothetical protein PV11_00740 [Exophiala sideris]|uniref:Uncharacterized protein n=1 Tax=Exophiala sideris TaxID=1016849 RepID=A0A0D1YU59_9EURO|nr:hypothetical protein PV11_00740 [Exophiala sideris]
MQLDSHRRQPSFTMPCRWSRRCRAAAENDAPIAADSLPSPTTATDVDDWKKVRKEHLRTMRRSVRHIVLLMALMEAIRVGPIQLVFTGKHGFPEAGQDDFGIAYNVGYFLSWLYLCVFMVVYVPLFSWWLPNFTSTSESDRSKPYYESNLVKILTQINMVLLPVSIGMTLITYVFYAISAVVYVDSRPKNSMRLPKNSRKNWLVRLYMLVGIAITTLLGYGAFNILANFDLAHVKPYEYAIIVVPVQINLGILLATVMQFKMEKRLARKEQAQTAWCGSVAASAAAAAQEKAALLEQEV